MLRKKTTCNNNKQTNLIFKKWLRFPLRLRSFLKKISSGCTPIFE